MNTQSIQIIPTITIPEHLFGEVKSKLAYVDETIQNANVVENAITLEILIPDGLSQQNSASLIQDIEKKVHLVVEIMAKGAIKPRQVVLEDFMDREVPFSDDPAVSLLKQGGIYRESQGVYTLGPLVSELISFFENVFLDLADSFNAKKYRFPTLISTEYLDRVKYFSAFPHSLSFVTHLREDVEVINEFAEHTHWEEDHLDFPEGSLGKVQNLLSPAVCYHLYFSLADKPLPGKNLTATAVGTCFRYESINLESLERLWDFSMREIIFVGEKDFVLENRETGRKRMAEFFEQIGFAYRVESANDPFFIGEFRKQAAFQSAFQLKYEIRGRLPFKDSTLAVGSYNYHQDFFGRNLNITLGDGTPVHTGCIAFGLERIAYAFLAQFGNDPDNWPAMVKDSIS